MNIEKISFEIIDSEPHQGEYISAEVKSKATYIQNCNIRLICRIASVEEPDNFQEKTVALMPVDTSRIYDIPVPISWPVSFDSEVEYSLELEYKDDALFSEELYILAPLFIYDFIYTLEHFYLFSERVIYSDIKTKENVCWVEFAFEGDSDKVDLMIAFNYKDTIKIMVCIAPGGVSTQNPWQKEHFEISYTDFSSIYIKRKMDEIFEKYASEYDVFPDDIDNDTEEAYMMIEEANEKMFIGDYDTAFRLLKQAKQIRELPDIYFEMGKCMIDTDYPLESCINEFQKANKIAPESFPLFDSFLYIIESYASRGMYEDAFEIAKQAVDYSYESADDYFQIGIIFKNFNFYDTAIKYLTKACDQDSENAFFYKELGDCYLSSGDTKNAEKSFEIASEIDINDPEADAITLLATVKFQMGKIEEARKLAYKALEQVGAFMVCGMNISNPDFTAIFNDKLWRAYIEKFPEMQDVKDGKQMFFVEDEFPFSDDFFV